MAAGAATAYDPAHDAGESGNSDVACCARLHNWCIDHRAPYVRYVRAAYAERGDRDQSGNSAPIFASRSNQGRPGPPVKNAMRDELAAELVDRDMVRPKRSKYRS